MSKEIIRKGNVNTSEGVFERFAIKTHFVGIGEVYFDIFQKYVMPVVKDDDIVFCSEKIIALCQGRVVKKADMKLSVLARFLSSFAERSYGGESIGVGEPYKMQFAIDTVGKRKVLFAAIAAGFSKLFGKKGVFYDIVGREVSGIDGFYGEVWDEYSDLGILIPEKPNAVCEELYFHFNVKCVIVDANDLGQVILGKTGSIDFTDEQLIYFIKDNPAGQGRECTPFIVVRKKLNNQLI